MILCCGEALIDMLPRETAEGEAAFAPHAGGAVFNTAVALGRLGAQVGFLSGLSTDFFGDMLRQSLRAAHVDHGHSITSARPTTLAFVRLRDGHASYAFYDENTAGRMIAPDDFPQLPDDVEALFFGGISLISEPCGSAYEELMRRETGRRLVMIDPNIRPGFVSDEAAYRARLERMIAMADIVKFSDEDLYWLEGEGDADALARMLLTRGPALVIVTRGENGATAMTVNSRIAVAAPPTIVSDTVGAGDTFNAGVLALLQERGLLDRAAIESVGEADLEAALSLGAAAAAVTVSRAGANPPWRHELPGFQSSERR